MTGHRHLALLGNRKCRHHNRKSRPPKTTPPRRKKVEREAARKRTEGCVVWPLRTYFRPNQEQRWKRKWGEVRQGPALWLQPIQIQVFSETCENSVYCFLAGGFLGIDFEVKLVAPLWSYSAFKILHWREGRSFYPALLGIWIFSSFGAPFVPRCNNRL